MWVEQIISTKKFNLKSCSLRLVWCIPPSLGDGSRSEILYRNSAGGKMYDGENVTKSN